MQTAPPYKDGAIMDTLKVLLKLMKSFGRSNPLIEYKVGHNYVSLTAFSFHGVPVGNSLTIDNSNYKELDTLIDSWIANKFVIKQ